MAIYFKLLLKKICIICIIQYFFSHLTTSLRFQDLCLFTAESVIYFYLPALPLFAHPSPTVTSGRGSSIISPLNYGLFVELSTPCPSMYQARAGCYVRVMSNEEKARENSRLIYRGNFVGFLNNIVLYRKHLQWNILDHKNHFFFVRAYLEE